MKAPPLFDIGQTVATPAALQAMQEHQVSAFDLLLRHVSGDYGDVCEEDRNSNKRAVIEGTRILSSYKIAPELTIWIITEADRSVTTLLLPEDY